MILRPGKYQLAPGTWTLAPGTWILALGTWTCDLLICTRQLNWHAPAPRLLVRRSLKDAQILYTTEHVQILRHKEKKTQVHTANTQVHTSAHKSTNAHIASPQELVGNPRCNVAPLIIAKHNQLSTLGIFTNV